MEERSFDRTCNECGAPFRINKYALSRGRGRYCSMPCARRARGRRERHSREQEAAIFWSRVDKTSGCWIWRGPAAGKGYGRSRIDGRSEWAHRVAYLLTVGEIPAGMFVCHRCDNPPCCNPRHLFLGTAVENNLDMKVKQRQARGEGSAQAKLNEGQVLAIRADARMGRTIAAEYGISPALVSMIRSRRVWRHIQ